MKYAILPRPFTGSSMQWQNELYDRGHWDGSGRFQDVQISESEYEEIKAKCEDTIDSFYEEE